MNTAHEQRRCTLHAVQASRLDLQDVWFRYFAVTGNLGAFEVDAYLNGLTMLDSLDRDLVSHAVNELILENRPPTAPFSTDADAKPTEIRTGDDPPGARRHSRTRRIQLHHCTHPKRRPA